MHPYFFQNLTTEYIKKEKAHVYILKFVLNTIDFWISHLPSSHVAISFKFDTVMNPFDLITLRRKSSLLGEKEMLKSEHPTLHHFFPMRPAVMKKTAEAVLPTVFLSAVFIFFPAVCVAAEASCCTPFIHYPCTYFPPVFQHGVMDPSEFSPTVLVKSLRHEQ